MGRIEAMLDSVLARGDIDMMYKIIENRRFVIGLVKIDV